MKSKIAVLLIAVILISVFLGCLLYKDPLNQVTIDEIRALDGFGPILSEKVINYMQEYPDADIEDLIIINGIGEERIKLLRKEFK